MVRKDQEDASRADAALVWRYLRDHGEASVSEIVDACFPTLSAGSAPRSTVIAVRKRSFGRALRSVTWMRAQGVEITLLSKPGFASSFILGAVTQGVEALASYGKTHVSGFESEAVSDFMGVWHGE